jgi:hypothetical protein
VVKNDPDREVLKVLREGRHGTVVVD